MPQVSAAVLRSTPSSTSASASIRRAAALFFSPLAALRSSEAVRSSRVIDTAAPIDAAPLKGQHRVRVSLIWESPMSHSFGPLVSDGRVEDGRGSLGAYGHRPVSHPRSSNRTSRFPASGFPTGFTARHMTGPLGAGVGGTERRVLDELHRM